MERGKEICKTLKGIRADIARSNDIDYTPAECHHEGDCAGTCPQCEREVRWLESQLSLRQRLGKAATIAGLSLAVGAIGTACSSHERLAGMVEDPNPINVENDTTQEELDGYIMDDKGEVCPTDTTKTPKPEPQK